MVLFISGCSCFCFTIY